MGEGAVLRRCHGPGLRRAVRRDAIDDLAGPQDRPATGDAATIAAYYREIAPFFDLELAGRGDTEFWRAIARRFAGARVLELGCGTGRVTRILARHARRVLAVDVSPEMLRRARQQLGGCPNVALVRADMRTLALTERFDLVVAADDPFCHIVDDADRTACVEVVARHLRPGGRFVLDALWCPEATRSPEQPTRRLLDHPAGRLEVAERWTCRSGHAGCHATYTYRLDGRLVAESSFTASCWTVDEAGRRLAAAGLSIIHRWGDYRRTPWDARTARGLIIEAVRR